MKIPVGNIARWLVRVVVAAAAQALVDKIASPSSPATGDRPGSKH